VKKLALNFYASKKKCETLIPLSLKRIKQKSLHFYASKKKCETLIPLSLMRINLITKAVKAEPFVMCLLFALHQSKA
jgi:hypothetical protein